MRISLPAVLLLAMAIFLPSQAAHSSSVLAPQHLGELVRLSEQVVLAKAVGRETFSRGWMIVTRTRFELTETVKGMAGRSIYVDSPGGEIGGTGLSVTGSPDFELGTSYLLMLAPGKDGAWRPMMLSYGLLRLEGSPSSGVFFPLDEAAQLDLAPRKDARPVEPVGTYDAPALLAHLRQVAVGAAWDPAKVAAEPTSWPRGAVPLITDSAPPVGCVFLTDGGIPLRWNRFDQGLDVTFYIQENATALQAGSVVNGLASWNGLEGLSVAGKLVFGDKRALPVDCEASDGSALNALLTEEAGFFVGDGMVQFGDPCNEIEDLEDCVGVLAFGGTFYYTNLNHAYNGTNWRTSALAFVVVNNGTEECLAPLQYHQMMAHELGHTLGFGHHTPQPAMMNAFCCNAMSATDVLCATYAYGDLPPNTPPEIIGSIAPVELLVPGPSVEIDFMDPPLFSDPDGDALAYQVGLTQTGIVFVEFVSPTAIRLSGINPGEVTLLVRANDNKGGIATLSVPVRVEVKPNTPPVVVRQPAPLALLEDQQVLVEFLGETPVFTDPDGEALTLSVQSSNPAVVTAAVTGGFVRFTGTGPGSATVVVQADDGREGTAEVAVAVQVDGKPVAVRNVGPISLTVGSAPVLVDMASPPMFEDPEGKPLVFAATTNFDLILGVSVSGSAVTVAPRGPGQGTVIFRATDEKGSTASLTVAVNVAPRPNRPPAVANAPETVDLRAGAPPYRRDLTASPPLFSDPDGDALSFSANSLAGQIASVRIDGDVLEVTPLRTGSTGINVFAVDGFGGLASTVVPISVGAPVSLENEAALPGEFAVRAAYPNPFNPATVLPVELPTAAELRMTVYDVMGRAIFEHATAALAAGRHEIPIDLGSRPSGVYVVRVHLGGQWFKQRVTLIK